MLGMCSGCLDEVHEVKNEVTGIFPFGPWGMVVNNAP